MAFAMIVKVFNKLLSYRKKKKKYCLQLDIALWRNNALLYVQIEYSTGMSHCR